eukprot:122669_1
MSSNDKTQQELQSKLDELERKYQSLERENVTLKGEVEVFKQKESEQNIESKHSKAFWKEIQDKCKNNDTEYIKSLIENKTLSVNDVNANAYGWSLLHYAAAWGAYEIAQLCISLGADVTLKTKKSDTALDWANAPKHHDVAQLLHFAAMKANTGERIREKADDLCQQS